MNDIAISGDVRFLLQRIARTQFLPLLWNNNGGLSKASDWWLPVLKTQPLKALGQIRATVCVGLSLSSHLQNMPSARDFFYLWIPLQAQTSLNNTNRLSENTCQLIVTVRVVMWFAVYRMWFTYCFSLVTFTDYSLQACGKALVHSNSWKEALQNTEFSAKLSFPFLALSSFPPFK